jgi:phage baseplate assembly protein W
MAGLDRITGKPLDGWAHVAQSIAVLLTTPKASRVMRRHFGSDLPRLVDKPLSPATIVDFYAATAGAIGAFEPRFKIVRMKVGGATANGELTLDCEGIYFPRGHLGDFSVSVPERITVAV